MHPCCGIVEAQQELEQRRLAGPGRAHQGDSLPGRDRQGQVVQDLNPGVGRVGEAQSLEGDLPPGRGWQGLGVLRGLDARLGGQQLHEPLARPGPAQQVPRHLAQAADRAGHQDRVEEEGRQLAAAQASAQDLVTADPQHHPDGTKGDGHRDGAEQGPEPGAVHRGPEGRLHPLAVAGPVHRLVAEGLDGANGVQHLVHIGPDIGDAVLAGAGQAPHPMADEPQGQDHQGRAEQDQPGQVRAGQGQHDHPAHHQEQGAQGHGQGGADHGLEQGGVRGQAGDDLAGAGGLEEAYIQAQHPIEDRLAQIRDHPLADPGEQIGAHHDGYGHGPDHAQEEQQGAGQGRLGTDLEPRVHQVADHLAEGEHGAGGDQQGQGRQQDPPQVGAHEAEQAQQWGQVTGGGAVGGIGLVSAHGGLGLIIAGLRIGTGLASRWALHPPTSLRPWSDTSTLVSGKIEERPQRGRTYQPRATPWGQLHRGFSPERA